jgi:hypothetical protein
MNNLGDRPLGDRTTVIDLADRDEMDDDMFPLNATKSWFTRETERRTLNFTPVIQEFTPKGSIGFGGMIQFDLGSVDSCDLLFSVAVQIRLGHWLPPDILQRLEAGTLQYDDPSQAWYWANSLGSAIIQKAEFLLEDQVLETVDGDFTNVFALLFTDVNTQFGFGVDGLGRCSIPRLLEWSETRPFPTSNGIITAILPFSFQRIRLRNPFPIISVKEGTVRVRITLRPFSECIRRANGYRDTCDQTPLGQSFTFQTVPATSPVVVQASSTVPDFADFRLVTYGTLVDGKLRKALLHAPFERMFREVQAFRFTEPKKYVVNTSSNGSVRLQLPLEVNGPIEELIWFIRRKGVADNNEWTNYSNTLEDEWNPLMRPFESMLVHATLQVNGIPLIDRDGDFFRRNISQRHKGGIVAYNQFVYGYSFAEAPGLQNPTGWMNASRSTDVRLRIDVRQPSGTLDLEWEVVVYSIALNWVRFENGIANKVFSS